MEEFMNSDLLKDVVSRPFVKNVSSADYEVNEKGFFNNSRAKIKVVFYKIADALLQGIQMGRIEVDQTFVLLSAMKYCADGFLMPRFSNTHSVNGRYTGRVN
ncbi:hypothetical protein QTN47_21355 [Danxiaibacter flavus]|uniref:Uncharacterized protein n=1 Tax=Danxiaibacter flavus TaxID=3049108 RepID=A0ABV3ZKN8_9BACT|nr:hypothetical protein QNM32_21360 [Chitinophagaceae bacterium DXS]